MHSTQKYAPTSTRSLRLGLGLCVAPLLLLLLCFHYTLLGARPRLLYLALACVAAISIPLPSHNVAVWCGGPWLLWLCSYRIVRHALERACSLCSGHLQVMRVRAFPTTRITAGAPSSLIVMLLLKCANILHRLFFRAHPIYPPSPCSTRPQRGHERALTECVAESTVPPLRRYQLERLLQ